MKFSRIRKCRRSFFQRAAITTQRSRTELHAQRPFRFLTSRVGADRRSQDGGAARVDRHRVAGEHRGPAVEPSGRGARLLLADLVVLRTVARALEPLRALAERDAATEMHAP